MKPIIHRCVTVGLVGIALLGCDTDDDDYERGPFEVTVSNEFVISWEGGGAGIIEVKKCKIPHQAEWSCTERSFGCYGTEVWQVLPADGHEDPLMPPVAYGAPLGGSDGADPALLEPGALYSVHVSRYRRCGEGCADFIQSGCTLFSPP